MALVQEATEIAFPFQFDATGRLGTISGLGNIIPQHLYVLIQTSPGERLMMPTYGTLAQDSVFAANDEVVRSQLSQSIHTAINSWEPGAAVQRVTAATTPAQPGVLSVQVDWLLAGVDIPQSTTVYSGGGTSTPINS